MFSVAKLYSVDYCINIPILFGENGGSSKILIQKSKILCIHDTVGVAKISVMKTALEFPSLTLHCRKSRLERNCNGRMG